MWLGLCVVAMNLKCITCKRALCHISQGALSGFSETIVGKIVVSTLLVFPLSVGLEVFNRSPWSG